MRLSTFILLPLTLVLASPNPKPTPVANPEPIAAPAPTLAAQLENYPLAEIERRQLTVSLLGATAIYSNGVICGGIGPLTGCLGTPGTQSVRGTINPTGATVSGEDFTFAVSGSSTNTGRVTTTTSTDAAGPTPGPARVALAAGLGAVALGLL